MTDSIIPLAELEKTAILQAILTAGSVSGAARALKISRTTIYSKMQRYGIKLMADQILEALKHQSVLKLHSR